MGMTIQFLVLLLSLMSLTVVKAQDTHAHSCCMCKAEIEVLEKRVADLEAERESLEEAQECKRGMGDDLSKPHRNYVLVNNTDINKQILCDTHTLGGGWIVIQRRALGNVDFYRGWAPYKQGFGNATGDHWMGLEAIHQLTKNSLYELRIDFRIDDEEVYARYSSFKVESESDNYRLRLGAYSGTIGEKADLGLSFSKDKRFTTFDKDNDDLGRLNCAIHHHGAWWYRNCHRSNLNGRWAEKTTNGVSWNGMDVWVYPTFTEMKIRRLN